MIKLIILLPRRADLSPEEFERHAREIHYPLVKALPGLRRLVVSRVLQVPTMPSPAYDAVAEDWFDDAESLALAMASSEGQAVFADAPNLLDMEKLQFMVVEEEEIALG